MGARSGTPWSGALSWHGPIRFDERLRWRRTGLFKLCANAIWLQKLSCQQSVAWRGDRRDQARTHRKFAFAQFLCDAQSVGRS